MKLNSSGRPYFILNVILTGVILLIAGYSFFILPMRKNILYRVCMRRSPVSRALHAGCHMHSHLIVRGRIDEALQWNSQSLRVFLFFAMQLVMRIALGMRTLMTVRGLKQITITDAAVSSAMAIVSFYPFMRSLWLTLF